MRRILSISGLAVSCGVLVFLLLGAPSAVAEAPPESLTKSLATRGMTLVPLSAADEDLVARTGSPVHNAVTLAKKEEPTASRTTTYAGRLTDPVLERSPGSLAVRNRLVYAILLEDVQVVMNGAYDPSTSGQSRRITTNMLYFVDALTGEGLLATTV